MRRALRSSTAALVVGGVVTLGWGGLAQGSQADTAAAPYAAAPMVGTSGTAAAPAPATTCSSSCVRYHGGVGGVGVTTGREQVYLVFFGSQWGTQGKDAAGYATFTGDPSGVAPLLQAFFEGLGSSLDHWSGIATQYCQGVTTGSVNCPTSAQHVAYPRGGALAGVWEDATAASPQKATAHQLAQEAEKAATHFGNITSAANRNAQYVILSPTLTNPDHYKQNGFCSWHDYTGDARLDGGGGVPGPLLAFTNLPYIPDAGAGCGANIQGLGPLAGVTIVEGWMYAETITDQFPYGGWVNSAGQQIGDLCSWKTTGAGRVQPITLSTGTFVVQGLWSNGARKGAGGCAIAHSVVT